MFELRQFLLDLRASMISTQDMIKEAMLARRWVLREPRDAQTGQYNVAAFRTEIARHGRNQGGLPASVAPQQTNALARFDREVHAFE
jgi:hypothetical protein